LEGEEELLMEVALLVQKEAIVLGLVIHLTVEEVEIIMEIHTQLNAMGLLVEEADVMHLLVEITLQQEQELQDKEIGEVKLLKVLGLLQVEEEVLLNLVK
jgi:hypothetical protein